MPILVERLFVFAVIGRSVTGHLKGVLMLVSEPKAKADSGSGGVV
jgi:hypothetical protein